MEDGDDVASPVGAESDVSDTVPAADAKMPQLFER